MSIVWTVVRAAVVGVVASVSCGQMADRAIPWFPNWENPPCHPLELTPDGSLLLVVNTPDARLEVFDATGPAPSWIGSVPVGIDPVTVRARTADEAWVVNHVSDSISIVDLNTMTVVRTIDTDDEPYDVVFAGQPLRAFVTCSQVNVVQVFDPANPSAPLAQLPILGEDPRAMAVSPDGSTVYVAVFESGNGSTLLGGGIEVQTTINFPPNVVNHPGGPYAGLNPPPNSGNGFEPPLNPNLPPPPGVGLIVKKDDQGRWLDDNGADWTDFVSGSSAALSGRPVGWDVPDRDLAVIDANSLSVSYVRRLMNACMAVGVNPATGLVTVIGTDAINEVRFEPNVAGRFVRVHAALVDPAAPDDPWIVDLNPHLDYSTNRIPMVERVRSIGDPRAIVWRADGSLGYVAGMGSNNLIVIDPAGNRAGLTETIPVGAGPAGLAIDESRGVLYVLNRFEGTVSVVDLVAESELLRVPFFDPTPPVVRRGRVHLYDTHATSGLGQASCASCHVDARLDRLAWDLGNPAGQLDPLTNRNLGAGITGLAPPTTPLPFLPHHPMKGPMTTQTLQHIIGLEPHHWRGDRDGIEQFNPAFVGLNGADAPLTPQQMQDFEDFLATVQFPPNPFRNADNTLPTNLPLPGHYTPGRFAPAGQPLPNGNAVAGRDLYRSTARRLDQGAFACVTCHTLPTGAGPDVTWQGNQFVQIPPGPLGERHLALVSVDGTTNRSTKIPHLRNLHEKVGMEMTQTESLAGFGYLHDGSIDSIARFISEPAFNVQNDQEIANLVAFMLCLSGSDLPPGSNNNMLVPPGPPSLDTHAAVGMQVTVADPGDGNAIIRLTQLLALSDASPRIGMIAKGRVAGEQRGWHYLGAGAFQSDRAVQQHTTSDIVAFTQPGGGEITFTVVVAGSAARLGIDRDRDGWLDRDELDVCTDPADSGTHPGGPGSPDVNGDLVINTIDVVTFLNAFVVADPLADFNRDGTVNTIDFIAFLNAWSAGCP